MTRSVFACGNIRRFKWDNVASSTRSLEFIGACAAVCNCLSRAVSFFQIARIIRTCRRFGSQFRMDGYPRRANSLNPGTRKIRRLDVHPLQILIDLCRDRVRTLVEDCARDRNLCRFQSEFRGQRCLARRRIRRDDEYQAIHQLT
jgi:hypothetical protein